jgi:hypothetical protein
MITGIKNLPQTPDEFYTLSINRIRGQHDEFKRCLALNALTRLVFAKRALEIVELKHAIYPREDESLFDVRFVTLVTSACAGIVVDSTRMLSAWPTIPPRSTLERMIQRSSRILSQRWLRLVSIISYSTISVKLAAFGRR